MATGIVSIAAKLMGMTAIAQALLVINVIAFVALCILTLIRLLRFAEAVPQHGNEDMAATYLTSAAR